MKTEVNPQDTPRAQAFELWMSSPMPMVTLTKTFDVSRLCRYAKKHGVKFNMLLCWCIGKAASQVPGNSSVLALTSCFTSSLWNKSSIMYREYKV